MPTSAIEYAINSKVSPPLKSTPHGKKTSAYSLRQPNFHHTRYEKISSGHDRATNTGRRKVATMVGADFHTDQSTAKAAPSKNSATRTSVA